MVMANILIVLQNEIEDGSKKCTGAKNSFLGNSGR